MILVLHLVKTAYHFKKIYGKSFHQVKLQVEDITSIQPVLGYHLTGALI
jgi:hypothetical protein